MLLDETGKPLIVHTWEQAKKAKIPEKVVVVSDSTLIVEQMEMLDGSVGFSSGKYETGTDRIYAEVRFHECDIIVNVQGDEPEIDPDHIDLVAQTLIDHPEANMATLATPFGDDKFGYFSSSCVKVVITELGKALYFSRNRIPFTGEIWQIDGKNALRHVGIYAYRRDFLKKFALAPQSKLEKTERLEQLRALELGAHIQVAIVDHAAVGIDTREDYDAFVKRYKGAQ